VTSDRALDLSIVIVNYNTRQLLLDCLASIYRTAQAISIECIVIDNASSDGAVEAVRALFPQVRVVANTQNKYFSAAYTQGIELATGSYVLVINPDTLVQGQMLTQLVQQMDQQPEIGAATTTMYFPDGRLQRNGSETVTFGYLLLQYTFLGKLLPDAVRSINERLWYTDWDRTSQREIGILPGSCIIAPKPIWMKVGGFDARMLMYFSDDYLSRAIRAFGKQTMYLVSDGLIHYEGASAKQISARALLLYLRDLLVYTRLVFGRPAQIMLALLLLPTWIVQHLKTYRQKPALSE
jgi:GT2 family glycosyltransferase